MGCYYETDCCRPCCCCVPVPGPQGPRGLQGPQGPQGPAGPGGTGAAAYGGIYGAAATTVTPTAAATFVQVPLANATPTRNIAAAGNTLTVAQAGDYTIAYDLPLTSNNAVAVTAEVRANGAALPASLDTSTTVLQTAGGTVYQAKLSKSFIAALPAGAVLDLAVSSATLPAGLTLTAESVSALGAIKMDAAAV